MKLFSFVLMAASLMSVVAMAEAKLIISDAWTTAPLTSKGAAAVYFTVKNEGDADVALTRASAKIANRAELHESSEGKDGVMQMQQVKEVKIPAGKSVEFKPHGLHVMLFDMKEKLVEGTPFSLTLSGATQTVETMVAVKPLAAKAPKAKKEQCH